MEYPSLAVCVSVGSSLLQPPNDAFSVHACPQAILGTAIYVTDLSLPFRVVSMRMLSGGPFYHGIVYRRV